MWIKITDTNLEEGKWYKTALQHNGKYEAIQKLKYERGLSPVAVKPPTSGGGYKATKLL